MAAKKKSSTKTSSGEGLSMDQLLEKYNSPVTSLSRGDKVKGVVLKILPKRVIVDIGGKSEGLVAEKAFKEAEKYIKTLKVGDEIEASVIVPETPEGFTILSLRQATYDAVWKKISAAQKTAKPVVVEGKSTNASGVIVDVDGLAGFVPRSQLGKELVEKSNSLVGKRFEVVVIDSDREKNKVVLSEKEVSEAEELTLARKAMEKIKEGDVYDGKVTTIYDFGCFVKINTKAQNKHKSTKKYTQKDKVVSLEGLVHISELSWEKVEKPEDVVSVGDKVKVKVIGKTKGKLALSIKQAQKDPWENISKRYKKDKEVEGEISKTSSFGVFVALEPGIEGLIHSTKIPPGKKLSKGEKIKVYIEEVDEKERRISLGLVLTAKPVGYK